MTSQELLEKDSKVQNYELVPPEGGWGIVITVAISLMSIVTIVPMTAFGLVFGNFLSSLGDETSSTAIINGMFNTILSFTGLAANQLLQKYSYRKVGIVGAILYFIGSFSTIFVTTVTQLIVSFGVIQGLGFGLMLPSIFTAFNDYFLVKKNMMMGIAQAIMVATTIVWPGLTKFLLDEYGFRGTLAIFSACSLNCIVAMITLQPVEWHMKRKKLPDQIRMQDFLVAKLEEPERKNEHGSLLDEKATQYYVSAMPRKSVVSVGSMAISVTSKVDKLNDKNRTMWQKIAKSLDLAFFKDLVFVNIACGLSFSLTSDLTFIAILPLLLENFGFGKSDITVILTIYFVGDLVSRILLSILSAVVVVRNRYLFLAGTLLSACFRTAFIGDNYFWWTATIAGALGFLRCLIQTPLPLVIAEQYSRERFATAFSLYMVVCGFIALTIGLLAGLVKALTESNIMVVHLLTVAYLLCGVPWCIELIAVKIAGKKSCSEEGEIA